MFDKLKKWLTMEDDAAPSVLPEKELKAPMPPVKAPMPPVKAPRKPKPAPELTPKELATSKGEPYISILSVDLDPANIDNGAFELDWNDKFIINLIKQGYKYSKKDTDQMIVDRWFQTVCRNIALEVYEQEIADPEKRDDVRIIKQKDLGDGFTEVS
jgi:hypothetical protein